jgi:hypothetical protein
MRSRLERRGLPGDGSVVLRTQTGIKSQFHVLSAIHPID